MIRTLAFVAALLAATPALASVTLTIQNHSSQAVTRLNVFAVDKQGVPVEDNLGALMEDIPAGTTGTLELGITACQRVYAAMGLGGSDEDITTTIDTCKAQTLVVND